MSRNESSSSPEITKQSNTSTTDTAPAELSAVVDELLNTLSNKFAGVSSEIFAKLDDMSRRLDNLESSFAQDPDRDNKGSPAK